MEEWLKSKKRKNCSTEKGTNTERKEGRMVKKENGKYRKLKRKKEGKEGWKNG